MPGCLSLYHNTWALIWGMCWELRAFRFGEHPQLWCWGLCTVGCHLQPCSSDSPGMGAVLPREATQGTLSSRAGSCQPLSSAIKPHQKPFGCVQGAAGRAPTGIFLLLSDLTFRAPPWDSFGRISEPWWERVPLRCLLMRLNW